MGTQNLQNLNIPNIGDVSGNQFLAEQVRRIGALQGGAGAGLEEAMTPVDTRAIGAAARGEMQGAWGDMQRQIQEAMVAGGKGGSSAQTQMLTTGGSRLAREFGGDVMRAGVGAAEAGRGRAMQGAGMRAGLSQAQTGAGQDLLSLLGRINMSGGGGAARPAQVAPRPSGNITPAGTGVGRSIAPRSGGGDRGLASFGRMAGLTQAGDRIQQWNRLRRMGGAGGETPGLPGNLFMQSKYPALSQQLMGNLPGAAAMGGYEVARQNAETNMWNMMQRGAGVPQPARR